MLKRSESSLKIVDVRITQHCMLFFTNYSAVCKLVFLPPYSPDLNPIEQAFSVIKAFLRRYWKDVTLGILDCACRVITPSKAWGFFHASGYVI